MMDTSNYDESKHLIHIFCAIVSTVILNLMLCSLLMIAVVVKFIKLHVPERIVCGGIISFCRSS